MNFSFLVNTSVHITDVIPHDLFWETYFLAVSNTALLAHSKGKGDRLDKILKHERLIVYNLLKVIFFLD